MKKASDKQVYEWLLNYHKNKIIYLKLQKEYLQHVKHAGPNISEYGKHSTLPKSNSIVDVTYSQVSKRLRAESLLNRFDYKIKYIDNRLSNIKDELDGIITMQLIEGIPINQICEKLDIEKNNIYYKIRKISKVINR